MEEGDVNKIDAFMGQLMSFYNNVDLTSAVAHLVLQLVVCYDHSTLVEPLVLQYKVRIMTVSFVKGIYVYMYMRV